jgi:prevent-host-death family protein
MMELWQLQDAKNKFSEVVEKALKNGPQVITKRGIETVVIMSVKDYQKLTRPKTNIVEFFRKSPLSGVDIDITRDKDYGREVDF